MPNYSKIILGFMVMGLGLSAGYCALAPQEIAPSPPKAALGVASFPTPTLPEAPAPPAPPRLEPDPLVEPFVEPPFPHLPGEDPGASASVGTVTNGYLVNAAPLPEPARSWAVLPRQCQRGLAWGTEELVGALQYAADAVYAQHRRRLWIGNMARRGGGDIRWSVSHNSGRDADIAFCYKNAAGEPVDPPDLVPLDRDGRSANGGLRFDVACTWTTVKALLTWERAQVQYLFISAPLKKELLAYARRKGEPKALLERADATLGPPGLAAPHDDHLHLRLYCSRRDVEAGCVNGGKVHPGTDLFEERRGELIQKITRTWMKDGDAGVRARAVERLEVLGADGQAPAIARLLDDPSPEVRRASARALGALRARSQDRALAARFRKEDDPSVRVALLLAASELATPEASRLITHALGDPALADASAGPLPDAIQITYSPPPPADPRVLPEDAGGEAAADDDETPQASSPGGAVNTPRFSGRVLPLEGRAYTVQLAAVEAAAGLERGEPVEALIQLLSSSDPLLRGRVARALGRLTNHAFGPAWDDPALSAEAQARGVQAWQAWFDAQGHAGRNTWLARGFEARGFQVPKLDKKSIWELVRAVSSDDYISYNAQRTLMILSRYEPLTLAWSKHDAAWHWTRWFERRRRQFGLKPCPPALATFNR